MAVRVLAMGLPRMLNDIVTQAVSTADDVVLLPATGPERHFAQAEKAPDVVVYQPQRAEAADIVPLLLQWPRVAVIAVEPTRCSARIWRLRPTVEDHGEISPGRLLMLIRAAAADGGVFGDAEAGERE